MNYIVLDDLPIIITKVQNHKNIKARLLELIDEMPNSAIDSTNCSVSDKITKSDWLLDDSFPRPYLDFIKPTMIDLITEAFKSFNSVGLAFTKFWFQQYKNGDIHDWHVHSGCHFTNVYFIELPDTKFKTEIQNWNRKKLIDLDISEGTIVTFPSMLYHRSPKNYSTDRKTIISFNVDLVSSGNTYV